jgi:hypothetical protein
VIYDPFSSLHQENENDNIKVRAVLDTLTEINHKTGTTAIVVDHFNKPSNDRPQSLEYRLRGATSKKDWCDTLVAMTVKKAERRVLRELHFLKVRSGPIPRNMILERDKQTFIHTPTDEGVLCPSWRVAEILSNLGGEVDRQRTLVDAIKEEVDCSLRSAQEFIREAVNTKTIREESRGNGRAKGYAVNP